MQSLLVRLRSIRILPALAFVALPFAACGDDDPVEPPGNGGPNLSLIATPLSDAVQNLVTLNDALDALSGLSGSIGGVMGPGGFSAAPADAPRLATGPRDGGVATSVLSVLAHRGTREPAGTVPPRLSAQPPLALGVTCVWGLEADQYVGDGGENAFGAPRQDETFFELYEPDVDGTPVLPLLPIGGFTSVRPLQQGSVLDVQIFAEQDGETVIDFLTQGTFSGPNTFDIQLAGTTTGEDGSVLDYDVDLTPTVLQTSASVQDILLGENVSTQSGGTLVLTVDKTGSGAASLVFTIQFDLADPDFPISSGTVTLDGTTVATISGSQLSNPVITLTEDGPLSPSDRTLLAGIFGDADTLTGGVGNLLIIGSCIGSEDREFCSLLPQPDAQG